SRTVEGTAPDRFRREEDPGGVQGRARRSDEAILVGRGGNPRVTHQKTSQGRWRQGQVPAAELFRLDVRMLAVDVDQPAMVFDVDAQLERKGAAGVARPARQLRKDALQEPSQVRNMVHRNSSLARLLIGDPAGCLSNRVD